MQNHSFRILVVDDEADICDILSYNLRKAGYEVDVAHSAEEALKTDLSVYDLFLLDVMMGEMSGFTMATRLKENPATTRIPVIFLTAKDSEDDTLEGLSLGADDYITKPFSIREVVARIGVVLRRFEKPQSTAMVFRTLTVDPVAKTVTVDGAPVLLTRIEFELLCCLLESRGRVLSRQDLIARVWPKDEVVLDRTVDVNITRLRKKIGPYASCIRTRSGYGYFFGE
jgi:DNA-binding response OmpR family regulator